MAYRTPGDIIHYRAFGSKLPLWPAVVCTDDIAPPSFLKSRPSGYVTVILHLGDNLNFCWAQTNEMHDYDPMVPFDNEEMVTSSPGLGEAYAVANSALEAGIGLEHWKSRVGYDAPIISLDEGESDVENQRDVEFDRDIQRAIQLSLEESGSTHTGESCKTSPQQRQVSRTLEDPFTPLSSLKKKGDFYANPFERRNNQLTITQNYGESSKAASNSATNDLLSWSRLGQTSVPTSDTIDGKLIACSDYVQVHVGPSREERLLHKNAVWDRPYFREPRIGIMLFELDEAGTWELSHPALVDIEPEDFAFIAEYLESGDFGYRNPKDEEEINEMYTQMGTAWTVAEQLGMTDLMDHIVDKLEGLEPWDLINMFALACYVYASSEASLPGERMKDALAAFIAQNFWIYIEDDHLSATFIQRLKDFPELERDILMMRTKELDTRLDPDEDEEEEENEDNHCMDLD